MELLNDVKLKFGFMSRRVNEIKDQIVKIGTEYMDEVTSEEEMRYLLLSPDLDNKDPLNMIYDNELVEFLKNPFAQNIVL